MQKQKLPNLTITRLQIGEFEVPVPHGLSELLNRAGAWKERKEAPAPHEGYTREVVKVDGKIVTRLRKIS